MRITEQNGQYVIEGFDIKLAIKGYGFIRGLFWSLFGQAFATKDSTGKRFWLDSESTKKWMLITKQGTEDEIRNLGVSIAFERAVGKTDWISRQILNPQSPVLVSNIPMHLPINQTQDAHAFAKTKIEIVAEPQRVEAAQPINAEKKLVFVWQTLKDATLLNSLKSSNMPLHENINHDDLQNRLEELKKGNAIICIVHFPTARVSLEHEPIILNYMKIFGKSRIFCILAVSKNDVSQMKSVQDTHFKNTRENFLLWARAPIMQLKLDDPKKCFQDLLSVINSLQPEESKLDFKFID